MPSQLSGESFIAVVQKSGLVEADRLQRLVEEFRSQQANDPSADALADYLVAQQVLTPWQAEKLLQGKHKGYFLGKYRLLSLLGRGGMSHVYLGEHVLMRRRCAIKVLPAKRVNDSSYLRRFIREAEAVAKLDHPNIVRAYDIDHQTDRDNEIHFLVMEYVEGTSLQDLVASRGPQPFLDAVDWVRQAAQGLAYAHQMGLVHRDIKPGNLLLDRQGVVKILDLGLARFFDENRADSDALTIQHDERVLGTADYLAPEQALDSHRVDARADIYSLGCTLYFLLSGHPPFTEGTLAQRLMAHQQKEPPPIEGERPDIPAELAQILRKMMAKQPEERYSTAAEVADLLLKWLSANSDEQWRTAHALVFGRAEADSQILSGRSQSPKSGVLLPPSVASADTTVVRAVPTPPSSKPSGMVAPRPPAAQPSIPAPPPTEGAASPPTQSAPSPAIPAKLPAPKLVARPVQPGKTHPGGQRPVAKTLAEPSAAGNPAPSAAAPPASVSAVAAPGAPPGSVTAGTMPAAPLTISAESPVVPIETPAIEPELASFFAGLSATPKTAAPPVTPVASTPTTVAAPASPPSPEAAAPTHQPTASPAAVQDADTVDEFDPLAVQVPEPTVDFAVQGDILFVEPTGTEPAPTSPTGASAALEIPTVISPAISETEAPGFPPVEDAAAAVSAGAPATDSADAVVAPVIAPVESWASSTVSRARRTAPAKRPPAVQQKHAKGKQFPVKWLALSAVAVAGIALVAGGGYALGLFGPTKPAAKTVQKKALGAKQSKPTVSQAPAAASEWSQKRVAKVGPSGDFKTITEALLTAKKHFQPILRSDRFLIQVEAGKYDESLSVLGPDFPENVVIEGAAGMVLAPSKGSDPVLRVRNVEGFEIRGLTIDAGGRPIAVELADRLPRCHLQQLAINGFSQAGIAMRGAVAFSFKDSRLFLRDLRLEGSESAVGLVIERGTGSDGVDTSHVLVERCRFLGPLAAGATVKGADVLDVEFRECIFAKCQVGVKFLEQTGWRECQFVQNTFYQCGYGVLFAEQPPPTQKGLSFRRNLFAETARTEVFIEQGFDYQKLIDSQMLGPIFHNWTDKPKLDPKELPPGELALFYTGRTAVESYGFLSTDPRDQKFLAPSKDSPQGNVSRDLPEDQLWIGAVGP
jgi:serine/threonine protein kinase